MNTIKIAKNFTNLDPSLNPHEKQRQNINKIRYIFLMHFINPISDRLIFTYFPILVLDTFQKWFQVFLSNGLIFTAIQSC